MTATPTKLRNGSWGAKVQGTPKAGQEITIQAKNGKSWTATVQKVLWSGDGVSICATASAPKSSADDRFPRYRDAETYADMYGEGAALRRYGHTF